jgi:hypothetical protein
MLRGEVDFGRPVSQFSLQLAETLVKSVGAGRSKSTFDSSIGWG